MSLPALATVAELATWLHVTLDDGDPGAQLALEFASGLVRDAAGQTWVHESNTLDNPPPAARAMTLSAAARGYTNPTGASQQRTGPYSASWDHASIALSEDERQSLSSLAPNSFGGLAVISVTRGDLETPPVRDDCLILEDPWWD